MNQPPKNGILSGMFLTYMTAVIVLLAGLFFPDKLNFVNFKLSTSLLNLFLISVLIMAAHKLESYLTKEFDVCPVYLTSSQNSWGKNPRQALFVGFVGTFLLMMLLLALVLRGGVWPFLLLAIWIAQGLHEWHHLGKSIAQKSYYSGVVSAVCFVLFMNVFLFPQWLALFKTETHVVKIIFYSIQPVILTAFYFEHLKWLKLKS